LVAQASEASAQRAEGERSHKDASRPAKFFFSDNDDDEKGFHGRE
jgi:hypothetical protein